MPLDIAEQAISLRHLGIRSNHVFYQLTPQELTEQTVLRGQGELNNTGALCVRTGKFTGRSPQDRFIVKDSQTAHTVHWNKFNIPIEEKFFFHLREKMAAYLSSREEIWVRDCYASAHPQFRLNIRVINENPWSNLFAHNLFLRPKPEELERFEPDWIIMQAPGFEAEPEIDGVRSPNFGIISFQHKMVLIGGSGYTGEMKKAIFSILNYMLPHQHGIMSMHCSANLGADGETAIFFGLSGTGKTTLSTDPARMLIGDDEHGWMGDGVFNFEGGCYAKCINLSAEKEPEIFNAIRPGALLENVVFKAGTNEVDFENDSITENTRVSYPIHFIANSKLPSVGPNPRHIFYLTADANGVLPPLSRLTTEQAMYQFISGYTAKVAGTEAGVTEPKSTFSACFGAPFMPLHPGRYAELLGKKLQEQKVQVWLINTGWSGGPYGVGERIALRHTRAIINAVLNHELADAQFDTMPIFNFEIPTQVPGVPTELLKPWLTWANQHDYFKRLNALAAEFVRNFELYTSGVSRPILEASPVPTPLS